MTQVTWEPVGRQPATGRRGWVLRSLLRSLRGSLGTLLATVVVSIGVFAYQVAPQDPNQVDVLERLRPPMSDSHVLGTDAVGRDIASRVAYGTRTSLLIAGTGVVCAAVIGVMIGLVSGYRVGLVDTFLMRLAEVQLAFPPVLLAILIVATVPPSVALVLVILVATGWPTQARLVRGQVLSLREREFIQAARVIGASQLRIVVAHILPNVWALITVVASLQLAQMILLESSLSFLGLGIPADVPSWGRTVNEGIPHLSSAWWISFFPGALLVVTVSAVGLLGDWLRDFQDVRIRGSQ